MYLVVDSATNNVLAEFDSFQQAEQRRIEIVGGNPALAEYVEVVDLDRAVEAYRADVADRQNAHEPQPA